MYFEQFYLTCLAHASYMIGANGEAAVVDPQRDVDIYLKAAEEHNQVGVAPANVGQGSLDKGEIVHAAHGKTAAANSTLPPVPVKVFAKHLRVARTGATGLNRRQTRLGDDRSGQ